jgi:hypothetical protein
MLSVLHGEEGAVSRNQGCIESIAVELSAVNVEVQM